MIVLPGWITVPAKTPKALGLTQGDKVAYTPSEGGRLEATFRPVRSVAEMTFYREAKESCLARGRGGRRRF